MQSSSLYAIPRQNLPQSTQLITKSLELAYVYFEVKDCPGPVAGDVGVASNENDSDNMSACKLQVVHPPCSEYLHLASAVNKSITFPAVSSQQYTPNSSSTLSTAVGRQQIS
eukprot:gene7709-877_t